MQCSSIQQVCVCMCCLLFLLSCTPQSASPRQSVNEASVEELEYMDPVIETTAPRELLTTEDIKAADAVSLGAAAV